MKIIKSFYINHRFFYLLGGAGAFFIVSFFVPVLFGVVVWLFVAFLLVTVVDIFLLYSARGGFTATRQLPDRLSNGDENPVRLHLTNHYPVPVRVGVIDEIPFQFQKRDFLFRKPLSAGQNAELEYHLRPTSRGEYQFGKLNVYVSSILGLITRRFIFSQNASLAAYPSFIQLRKYDLMAFHNNLCEYGLKRIRRIGHTMEFEQIREFVQGDDIRTINWKASSKKNALMVNQYQDLKSQDVYQVIDTGRVMQMPFGGLSLLDYAINCSLALSNIVLKKHDRCGMFTFSRKLSNFVRADKRAGQMHQMMENLYRIETDFMESDFSRLFADMRQLVPRRSLLLMYSNFDTMDALYRQLPFLKEIASRHLLVIVFFENTELRMLIQTPSRKVHEVYDKIIAEKFSYEKRLILRELQKFGIQSILTQPQNLTVDTINKYLEIKARGMI